MSTAKELMTKTHERLQAQAATAAAIGATYKFVLSGDGGGTFLMNLKDAVGVTETDGPADCTIKMSATDYVEMMHGRANAQALFFQGKLQVEGDMGLALKLQNLTEILRS
ncbi:MAG TPA: SCP2 sterol-binding domain-containing protein [Polyangiaceae bacterium]|jgi:putative sterol carrier protein|nr:SCP2 sterol-binding domain-containing protein [Polyangiaceae bacterium]